MWTPRAALVALGEQRELHLGFVRALLDVAQVVEPDDFEEVELAERAGQTVGVKQVSEHIWLVSFMDYGHFDDQTCRLEPVEDPLGPKVLPMSSEQSVTHVSGLDPEVSGGEAGIRILGGG